MASKHYVNNRDFLNAIIKYRVRMVAAEESGKTKPIIPDYAGECISLLCERLSRKSNFNGYSYRDEMAEDAIENCLKAFDKFDPTKSNSPFAYFSRIAWRAMLRRIHEEKKENYIKHKNMRNMFGDDQHQVSHPDWQDPRASRAGATGVGDHSSGLEASNQVIENFEALMERKRIKKVALE